MYTIMKYDDTETEFRKLYVYLDTTQVKILVNKLKLKKKMTQKIISEKIESNIGSVLTRGSALRFECYRKLEELAKTINIHLSIKKRKFKQNHSKASMQNLALKIGVRKTGIAGEFLSENYKGMNENHIWQCGKCGTIWKTSPNSILYQESWCKRCSGRETWSYEQMIGLARKRGEEKTGVAGKFLMSREEYDQQSYPDRSKYPWECGKCGYIWEATANNIKHGSWCRECQYTLLSRMFKKPYDEILDLAKKVGIIKTGYAGKFLASKKEYDEIKKPSHHKFKWKCGKCKSIFEMDITHVTRPQWCPSCTEGESEQICRGFFERIFKAKFPKLRPNWLINSFSRGQMHLDGYNKNLKLAFEFNGPQHYLLYPKYHKCIEDFTAQQERDKIKSELCKKNCVILITVPYTLDYDEFQKYIIKEYRRLTKKEVRTEQKYDWKTFNQENLNLTSFF